MDLHCVTDKLSKATLLITHKGVENLGYSSLDGLTLQGEPQQNNFILKEQGGLMHTGNSYAEQQRQMFISSEHIQTDSILISFSLKIRALL